MKHLSAIILARNEEKNIVGAIESVNFADEIIVLDDGSSDDTKKVAEKKHAIVIPYQGPNDFSKRRNYAGTMAHNDWLLYLDADERIPEKLREEIKDLPSENTHIDYAVKRVDYFWHHPITHGELYHANFVRLVHKKTGSFVRPVHEVWNSKNSTVTLQNALLHYPHQTITEFLNTINEYSTLNAGYLFQNGKKTNFFDIVCTPLGKFVYTYFVKRGFLDGPGGFVYSFMMSFHSFLTRSKLYLLCNDHTH